jgi:pimeloyl-ACP methyl ester carboxylesterase
MSAKIRNAALAISIVAASAIAVAVVSGVFYEQAQRARDREQYPQIGRSVDIGGRTLNIYCSGTGRPAVVFESGSTWAFYKDPKSMWEKGTPRPGYSWVSIQRELAKLTTSCWYDRAGSGWSDLGPYPRDSASQARDLHALLEAAEVPSPYVLVAESSAALDVRVYTGFYPAEVAGVVFVNAVHPDFFIRMRPAGRRLSRSGLVGHSQDALAQIFNQIGLYRLGPTTGAAPAPLPKGMTDLEWNTVWHLTHGPKASAALMQDIASWEPSTVQARAAGSLGDRPLFVVSSENTAVASEYRGLWMELQTDLARLSTRGKLVSPGENGGDPVYQAPDAVIDAIRQILGDVR